MVRRVDVQYFSLLSRVRTMSLLQRIASAIKEKCVFDSYQVYCYYIRIGDNKAVSRLRYKAS